MVTSFWRIYLPEAGGGFEVHVQVMCEVRLGSARRDSSAACNVGHLLGQPRFVDRGSMLGGKGGPCSAEAATRRRSRSASLAHWVCSKGASANLERMARAVIVRPANLPAAGRGATSEDTGAKSPIEEQLFHPDTAGAGWPNEDARPQGRPDAPGRCRRNEVGRGTPRSAASPGSPPGAAARGVRPQVVEGRLVVAPCGLAPPKRLRKGEKVSSSSRTCLPKARVGR